MGKRHKNIFADVVNRDNLWRAYQKAARGKRDTIGYLQFRQNEAANIARLEEALQSGEYRPGEPRRFLVYEPKPRQISALPFVDRIAQHALCNVIEPIFDRVFLPQSYACRVDKGTHRAAIAVQSMLRKTPDAWVLKTDFSKYFASIDRAVLQGPDPDAWIWGTKRMFELTPEQRGRFKPNAPAAVAPVRVTNDAEYRALPPGTRFITPDGKTGTKS